MPLKILIAPDKFKGTLTAEAAGRAITSGWRSVRPGDDLEFLPITDGGDGFGEAMRQLLLAEAVGVQTVDAAHRPCRTEWWWDSRNKTAIIESANVIGLAQLPHERFHPFGLDTFGLGKVLKSVSRRGAERCLIGIGGSATNDGGFGLARALGWEFLDRDGKPIETWTDLIKLEIIKAPPQVKRFKELIIAVDVQNKLLGKQGCSRIYGPQKGLKPADFPLAEKALGRLATCAAEHFGKNFAVEPGAGASGGLGFGLLSFAGAKLQPGFDLFAAKAKLARRLSGIDMVITGEGSIDASTLMGKGVGELARLCQKRKIACLGLAGTVNLPKSKKKYFMALNSLVDWAGAEMAKNQAALCLCRLSAATARRFVAASIKTRQDLRLHHSDGLLTP